jgi:hypothetical protein
LFQKLKVQVSQLSWNIRIIEASKFIEIWLNLLKFISVDFLKFVEIWFKKYDCNYWNKTGTIIFIWNLLNVSAIYFNMNEISETHVKCLMNIS